MDIIDPHDQQVMVRLTAEQHRRLYDIAHERGISRALLARQLIVAGLAREGVRAGRKPKVKSPYPKRRPSQKQIAATIKAYRP